MELWSNMELWTAWTTRQISALPSQRLLWSATRRQTWKPRCCIREGRTLATTTLAFQNPQFSPLPAPIPLRGEVFPPQSRQPPAEGARAPRLPMAAEGRCGAGGPPASPPVTPPGPPGRLPASLRCLPGPSVLGRPSPSWIRGAAAAAVARSVSAPIASSQRLPHGPGPGLPAGPPLRGAGGAGTRGWRSGAGRFFGTALLYLSFFLLVLISWGLSGGTGRGL